MEKLVKSEIEHHMPFMVLDFLYKYQWFVCKDQRSNGGGGYIDIYIEGHGENLMLMPLTSSAIKRMWNYLNW